MSGKAKIRIQAQIIDGLRDELRKASHPRVAGCRLHPTANHYDYAGLLRCAECEAELKRGSAQPGDAPQKEKSRRAASQEGTE